ncbi:RNA polymerase sigma factor [Alicyclobacillus fastidiosus]|uniref:RNA polymerase sigma factor n=1 Tax=Alicyclobacillus fastidiosus TaxID=392011 RepID=A0ABV5AJG6_9BACL|nr:RNA polymerase sigma factor [Alicyclobacillus fastidiosus]WEH08381.1 RNA polymerase sigma factor [Alicyclobacillus fastidiosus]
MTTVHHLDSFNPLSSGESYDSNERGYPVTTTARTMKDVENLYLQYASDLYRFALLSLRNSMEAEDTVQEVFLRVIRNGEQFRGDSQIKTWMWQIARNYIADTVRKSVKDQKAIWDVSKSYSHSLLDTLVEVEDLLSVLPEWQRKVFALRMIKDFSVADTAKLLECSEGKVRTDTHRAIQRLKKFARDGTMS